MSQDLFLQAGAVAAGAAAVLFWLLGLVHLWRRQSASRPFVSVGMGDRLVALLWPLVYLVALVALIFAAVRGAGRR